MTTCESGSLCFFRPTLALPHLISWDNKRAMMMEMRDPGNKSTCDEASANPSSHLTLVEFSPSSPSSSSSSSSSSSFPPLITKTMAPVGFFETLQERRSGRGTPLSAPEREREREEFLILTGTSHPAFLRVSLQSASSPLLLLLLLRQRILRWL